MASMVRRTKRSEFWMAIQASEPSRFQVMATGFEKKSVGAGVVARLTPLLMLRGASRRTSVPTWADVTSSPVAVLKTDTSPWLLTLNRNGPFGDAPVLTT